MMTVKTITMKVAEENDKSVILELYIDNEQQISKDVKTITENKGAEKVLVEKLNKFKTKFAQIAANIHRTRNF